MSLLKQPRFGNAEILSKKNPDQFKLVKRRRSLRGGDLVKLVCAGDVLMIAIYRTLKSAYFGKVVLNPKLTDVHGLESGDRVKFLPEHVCRALRDGHWVP